MATMAIYSPSIALLDRGSGHRALSWWEPSVSSSFLLCSEVMLLTWWVENANKRNQNLSQFGFAIPECLEVKNQKSNI